ncbi:hypothetical protein B2G94_10935 [Staphylococcus hominis subsp. hominis]|uniref:hypothetical protein n=1 Tax=Staphylococcus TaxID=1279 RepID=UPI000B3B3C0A|nr:MULTISPECIES: hypothetical protein [Staphylococcus]AUJ52639.1 hypothetical protein B7P03_08610 [Staphylococcus hominis subsp. hominis]MCG1145681.1 hypothetical protein [Staphylococcus epidermidis]MCG1327811.1 hypothetical protein [Staphylococcus epidermidis]MCG1932551.1 hypothetical protein [Staphylococcus epidermidis]MCG1933849.1 hypothetical protein [Staphylococcus epidermidis]
MARTYNAVKYVIKKNINDFKIHGLRLYEFNIKDKKAINISQPIFVNRATLIEKIQNGEVFTRAFRVNHNTYYAGQLISLSLNKNGYINNNFEASRDIIRNVEVSILDYE